MSERGNPHDPRCGATPAPSAARRPAWTPARRAAFLRALADTGSVAEAARTVGMTRQSVYKLRRRLPSGDPFVRAWDMALAARPALRRARFLRDLGQLPDRPPAGAGGRNAIRFDSRGVSPFPF